MACSSDRRWLLPLLLIAACGEPKQPAPAPPAPQVTAPPDAAIQPTPVIVVPDAAVAASGTCNADAEHCCQSDGTLARPGGCSPLYPDGVLPATVRGDDGYCEPIPCYKKCLPANARIATPSGEVAVSDLAVGDAVWTVDEAGARIATEVLAVQWVPVLAAHEVIEIDLADGRTVRASADHPLAESGTVGALAPGATLDGSTVTGVRAVPYHDARTWDLLPDGATGAYWADGVLLGSTLAP